jgi:hypothetical protein
LGGFVTDQWLNLEHTGGYALEELPSIGFSDEIRAAYKKNKKLVEAFELTDASRLRLYISGRSMEIPSEIHEQYSMTADTHIQLGIDGADDIHNHYKEDVQTFGFAMRFGEEFRTQEARKQREFLYYIKQYYKKWPPESVV